MACLDDISAWEMEKSPSKALWARTLATWRSYSICNDTHQHREIRTQEHNTKYLNHIIRIIFSALKLLQIPRRHYTSGSQSVCCSTLECLEDRLEVLEDLFISIFLLDILTTSHHIKMYMTLRLPIFYRAATSNNFHYQLNSQLFFWWINYSFGDKMSEYSEKHCSQKWINLVLVFVLR